MERDSATLLDIINASKSAIEFCGDLSKEQFLFDLKTQSAIVHQLLILGEAVKCLSIPLRDRNTDVPWRAIAVMRDRLIHSYDQIDVDAVWITVKEELPKLIGNIERIANL